ncbi:AIPR family protein [Oceanobacter sp. 4_MG-2023]|uniref:AIPR family protein n=1 Tax=Oceanobacter sp. 4_MG-2023 TaxID=3062623 RepID=UPI0027365261|nr:AIPR family protein [Oceanobacter sp. 4_MG-2023]MDP2546901.1 AIPR family protein [Oceanobacter sp. 4_MG-2023]
MKDSIEEFFHSFRQELMSSALVNGSFELSSFMETIADELLETGFTEGFELCHYRAQRGMRIDGYWFNDEGVLSLFIADFDSRVELESINRTEISTIFKRVINFFNACITKDLASYLEVTSPEYGLARQITDRFKHIQKLNLVIFSERAISIRIKEIPDDEILGIPTSFNIWDISRLYRQRNSRNKKEPLDLNFEEMFGNGIYCLPAHLGEDSYKSFLIVMPAEIIASLYGKYGAQLLEQNVRTFLQARGNVNKGMRSTILTEPGMFFAYNNGITATARGVGVKENEKGLQITRIIDLQIVNGGQTTASLFHTKKRDNADLSKIFVQMKLSVIDDNDISESVVPKISEYANTQNKVNAADFFSNHPFHIKMEELSRRLWAPAQQGAQIETHWFYERVRGQYADAQSILTPAQKNKFKTENPKTQMFTKTDLAKFENVWDEHPKWVNLGAQKNFSQYATRIGKSWSKDQSIFNEFYFKRAIARGIIFRATEKIISSQAWYNGGYRANIVAYTLATIGEIAKNNKQSIDSLKIWKSQKIDPVLEKAISITAKKISEIISHPPQGISNVTEWCKKDSCWNKIKDQTDIISASLPDDFFGTLISDTDEKESQGVAKIIQKIDDGIKAQKEAISISPTQWHKIHTELNNRGLLTPKEAEILRLAEKIPFKIPSEKQCIILLTLLAKAKEEGCIKP